MEKMTVYRRPMGNHLLYASSSSVYELNIKAPFSEEDKEDSPVSLYISSKNKPHFTEEELDIYYAGALDFWKEFCSNTHIYSPEGALLHKHLENLPNDPRYRWAFYKS